MEHELLVYLSKKLHEEIERFKDQLAMGGIKDIAGYAEVCGLIRGLHIANNLIMETDKRYQDED